LSRATINAAPQIDAEQKLGAETELQPNAPICAIMRGKVGANSGVAAGLSKLTVAAMLTVSAIMTRYF